MPSRLFSQNLCPSSSSSRAPNLVPVSSLQNFHLSKQLCTIITSSSPLESLPLFFFRLEREIPSHFFSSWPSFTAKSIGEQRIATIYTNSYERLLFFSWRRRTALIPSANIAVAHNKPYLYFVFYTGCLKKWVLSNWALASFWLDWIGFTIGYGVSMYDSLSKITTEHCV